MNQYIEKKLKKLNFLNITPIQKTIFENFNTKNNLIGIAPTGTGKTHAFLLPILSKIDYTKNYIQAIIVVPTNELVFQIFEMLKNITSQYKKTQIFYGGMDKQKILAILDKKQPNIIISTPHKIFEFNIKYNKLKINNINYLVLDEADMLLDEKFLFFLSPIFKIKKKFKVMLFSATFNSIMTNWIKQKFGPTTTIDLQKQNQNLKIKYFLLKTNDKLKTLIDLIKNIQPFLSLIFVSQKKDQLKIFQTLKNEKINILNFSSHLTMKKRKKYMQEIKKLKYQYIITSDLASRGLDLDVSLVINYDLPFNLEFFKHRCGRTGRMNKTGEVITIYEENDTPIIQKLKNMKFNLQHYKY